MFGKEDAVFVPSCCMANLIAILCHCSERGSEMIVGDKSHVYLFEQGMLVAHREACLLLLCVC